MEDQAAGRDGSGQKAGDQQLGLLVLQGERSLGGLEKLEEPKEKKSLREGEDES